MKKSFNCYRIRLKPTKEQERYFWNAVHAARWAYNYFIEVNNEQQRLAYAGKSEHAFLSYVAVHTKLVNEEKPRNGWMKDVGGTVMHQALMDADKAYKKMFKSIRTFGKMTSKCRHPKFKTRKKSKPSFYVRYDTMIKRDGGFRGERFGYIKTSEELPSLKKNEHYSNPRITYDGVHWWIGFSVVSHKPTKKKKTVYNKSKGVDVGLITLATDSDGNQYENINRTKRMVRLDNRIKYEQKKLSHMIASHIIRYDKVGKGYRPVYDRPLYMYKNIQKQKQKVKKLNIKQSNIRDNYLHHVALDLTRTKIDRLVTETIDIESLTKNPKVADEIYAASWGKLFNYIDNKCKRFGIEHVKANTWFPSSQLCSCCGNRKHDLGSARVFECDVCGSKIDRDLNAAINLANYK